MSDIFIYIYNSNIRFSGGLFLLNRVVVLGDRLIWSVVVEIVWLLSNGTESSVTFY